MAAGASCLALIAAAPVAAADLACPALTAPPGISITYSEPVLVEDAGKTVEQLNAMSGGYRNDQHSVFGLTRAVPRFEYETRATIQVRADGSVCMVPEVKIFAGFRELTVYLAREIAGQCRRNAIRDHEYEHVAAWRSHMKAGSRLMEMALQQAFSGYRRFDSMPAAQAELPRWVEQEIGPLQQRLLASVAKAQQRIDSTLSYRAVEDRMRGCP